MFRHQRLKNVAISGKNEPLWLFSFYIFNKTILLISDQCIFTIDPSDARDLDDAVCGRLLKTADDGVTQLYQISVHIADVSFFVREKTSLDEMASQRATSTYLVDRVG